MNLASINECRAAINYNAGRFIEQRLDEAVSRAVDEMIEQNRRANRTAALEAAHAACEMEENNGSD